MFADDATWDGYMRGEGDALHELMIPVVSGMATEVSAVIDYLITRDDLIVPRFATYGFSVAGLMSLLAANKEGRLDAAVMLSTPVRYQMMSVGLAYQWTNETIEEAENLDPLARPETFFPTALLFGHGARDDLVPVEAPRDLVRRLAKYHSSEPERLRLSEQAHMRHYLDKPEPYATATAIEEIGLLRQEAQSWLRRFLLVARES